MLAQPIRACDRHASGRAAGIVAQQQRARRCQAEQLSQLIKSVQHLERERKANLAAPPVPAPSPHRPTSPQPPAPHGACPNRGASARAVVRPPPALAAAALRLQRRGASKLGQSEQRLQSGLAQSPRGAGAAGSAATSASPSMAPSPVQASPSRWAHPCPHLHRDRPFPWHLPFHIGSGTGLTPSERLHRDWGSVLPTSAPGLGSPQPTLAPGLGSPQPAAAPGLGSPAHVFRGLRTLPARARPSVCSSAIGADLQVGLPDLAASTDSLSELKAACAAVVEAAGEAT